MPLRCLSCKSYELEDIGVKMTPTAKYWVEYAIFKCKKCGQVFKAKKPQKSVW